MAEHTNIRGQNQPASVPYPAKLTLPSQRGRIINRQRLIDLLAKPFVIGDEIGRRRIDFPKVPTFVFNLDGPGQRYPLPHTPRIILE